MSNKQRYSLIDRLSEEVKLDAAINLDGLDENQILDNIKKLIENLRKGNPQS